MRILGRLRPSFNRAHVRTEHVIEPPNERRKERTNERNRECFGCSKDFAAVRIFVAHYLFPPINQINKKRVPFNRIYNAFSFANGVWNVAWIHATRKRLVHVQFVGTSWIRLGLEVETTYMVQSVFCVDTLKSKSIVAPTILSNRQYELRTKTKCTCFA